MNFRDNNDVLSASNGVMSIDVATDTYPDAVTRICSSDAHLFFDGEGRWRAARLGRSKTLYVLRGRKMPAFHSLLLPDADKVDHIDHDGLNNIRGNLRPATTQQNAQNGTSHKDARSAYKGVSWRDRTNPWRATIYVNKRQIHIGQFGSEEAAARAYDDRATLYFGEFAGLNFPDAAAA